MTLGLSVSGHMSTIPVTRDSTIQNSESIPIVWIQGCYKNGASLRWKIYIYYHHGLKARLLDIDCFASFCPDHKHEEEDDGPDGSPRQLEDHFRVGDEDEAGAGVDDL